MKRKRQLQIANDHSKLRLQLFYLDELVQIANESLRHLDGQVDEGDLDLCSADLHQGTRAEGSRSPAKECSGSGTPTNNQFVYGLDCMNFSNGADLAR
jgi:hypothetical protein